MAMRTGSASIKEHGVKAAFANEKVAAAINASQAQAAKALNDYAEKLITSGTKTAQQVIDEISKSDMGKIVKDIDANNAQIAEMSHRLNTGDFFTKEDGESLLKMREDAAKKVARLYSEMYHGLYAAADYAGVTVDMGSAYRRILQTESAAGNIATRFPNTYALIKSRIKGMSDAEKNDSEIADLQERARSAEGKQATILQNRIKSLRLKQLEGEKSEDPIHSTIEEAHSFLKSINEDRFSPNVAPNDKRLLNELYDSVSKGIKDQWPGAWDKLQKINEGYKKNFIEVFREGAAGRMVSETKFGHTTPEQKMMDPFLKRGAQGVQEFFKVFGNGVESQKLVRQALADEFANATRGGDITPQMVKNFAFKHREFLEKFPDIKKEYENVETASKGLQDEANRLAELREHVVSSQLSKLLGTNDPRVVLFNNISSIDFMTRLQTMAKRNPEAAQAIAYEYGMIAKDLTPLEARRMLVDHEKELKPIFDSFAPGHYDKLLALSVGRQVLERGFPTIAYRMKVEPDALKSATGTETAGLANRLYAMATLKAGTPWTVMYLLSKYMAKEKLKNWEDVVADAFTNPKFVDELMQAEYGPLLQQAKAKGISVEKLVDSLPEFGQQGKKSLISALNKVKSTGKDYLVDLEGSFKSHGYRVMVRTPVDVEEKSEEQEKREALPQRNDRFANMMKSLRVQP
jgi:hypothetical protein